MSLRDKLEKIASTNEQLHAFIALVPAYEIQKVTHGPLVNLTFAVKDIIGCKGHANSFGLKPPLLPAASTDSAIVELLKTKGATLLGQTNLDPLCLTYFGANADYGRVVNPNFPSSPAMGSSSGSAAAVAAKLVDFSIGTDFGGSVRVPAAACGIYGLKCSPGCLPEEGSIIFSQRLDSFGIFAINAATLADLADVLLPKRSGKFKNIKILSRKFLNTINQELVEPYYAVVKKMEGLFMLSELEDCSIFENSLKIRRPLAAEDFYKTIQKLGLAENALPNIGKAICRYLQTLNAEGLTEAEDRRLEFKSKVSGVLADQAAILTPSLPCKAPSWSEIDSGTAHPLVQKLNLFLAAANVAGLPAISMPTKQLEFSLQLIADTAHDTLLTSLAVEINKVINSQ